MSLVIPIIIIKPMMSQIFSGIAQGFEPLFLRDIDTPVLYIMPSEERARSFMLQLAVIAPSKRCHWLPAWDCLPYDRIGPSQDILNQRTTTLSALIQGQVDVLVVSALSLLNRLPPASSLSHRDQTLRLNQEISMTSLIDTLSHGGYLRVDIVREAGEFAVRGDILDVFPATAEDPVRLDFFGDTLEKIRQFDAISQTTTATLEQVILSPSHDLALTADQITRFRVNYRNLFGAKPTPLYESISEGRRYAGMEHWLPLFF
jgi:transcription-repair coupling factor (superfamily II helicase)